MPWTIASVWVCEEEMSSFVSWTVVSYDSLLKESCQRTRSQTTNI